MWRSMRSTSRRAKHSKHRRSSTSFIARPLPQPEILATSLPRYLATSSPVVWRPLLALSVPLLACAWHIVVVVVVVVVVGGAAKAPAARRDMSLLEGAMATTPSSPSSPSSTTTEETPFASIIHSVSFAGTCVEVEAPRERRAPRL